jgi:hypothetical protein
MAFGPCLAPGLFYASFYSLAANSSGPSVPFTAAALRVTLSAVHYQISVPSGHGDDNETCSFTARVNFHAGAQRKSTHGRLARFGLRNRRAVRVSSRRPQRDGLFRLREFPGFEGSDLLPGRSAVRFGRRSL